MEDAFKLRQFDEALSGYLLNGEKILWKSFPVRKFFFEGMDWYITIIGLFSFLFSLFMALDSIRYHPRGGRDIFGFVMSLPFLLAGFYLFVGRLIYRYNKLANVLYVITNKRVIQVENFLGRILFKSLKFEEISEIERKISQNGVGKIYFKPRWLDLRDVKDKKRSIKDVSTIIIFYNIENVEGIYLMVADLKRKNEN